MGVEDYVMQEKLGKGAFATVYKIQRKVDNSVYACKKIDISKMQKNEISDAVNEIRVLASIRHPHVVGFYDAFLANRDHELWVVMELCACGDLSSKVDRYRKRRKYMDERVVWSHLIQMCEGLQCLHDHQIVHRDLKSANIFLAEDGSVKIGDLNVSKRMKAGLLRTQIGTPYYMSPEVWLNKPYGPSSDVWALGCLVYELCGLRPPFVGNTFPQLKQAILAGKYPALPRAFSFEMTAIVAKMIRVNARERPTVLQLLATDELKQRKAADWYKQAARQPSEAHLAKAKLMDTIIVPSQISRLQSQLPQPCFPDARPNSPEAWPVATETADRAAAVANKRVVDAILKPASAPQSMPIQPKGSAAALHAAHGNEPSAAARHANGSNAQRDPRSANSNAQNQRQQQQRKVLYDAQGHASQPATYAPYPPKVASGAPQPRKPLGNGANRGRAAGAASYQRAYAPR